MFTYIYITGIGGDRVQFLIKINPKWLVNNLQNWLNTPPQIVRSQTPAKHAPTNCAQSNARQTRPHKLCAVKRPPNTPPQIVRSQTTAKHAPTNCAQSNARQTRPPQIVRSQTPAKYAPTNCAQSNARQTRPHKLCAVKRPPNKPPQIVSSQTPTDT